MNARSGPYERHAKARMRGVTHYDRLDEKKGYYSYSVNEIDYLEKLFESQGMT